MPSTCIFCGEQPIGRNKEHVLPRWLIEITGNPKRPLKIPLRARLRSGLPDAIPFDALTSPACERCNGTFSDLETRARDVMTRMLCSEEISCHDINILLDWLDKVRTGLWLGGLMMIGNPPNIRPNFYISDRVAAKDRMVIIHRCKKGPRGLTAIGTELPLFWYHPVCFSLTINHLSFLSASTDFLISRRLGFPYPERERMTSTGVLEIDMAPGRERKILPLVRSAYAKHGTEIFQAIFHHTLSQQKGARVKHLYETDYVKNYSQVHENGFGKVLKQEAKNLSFYPEVATMGCCRFS